MRLYLSSFKLGDHSHKLPELAGVGAHAAIIANAQDHLDDDKRQNTIDDAHASLTALGFSTHTFDLRDYFDDASGIKGDLAGYDMLWVTGGNVFVLRSAMALSGFDRVIHDLLAQDRLVYGGYSAGVCVLAPHLYGLDICDDIEAARQAYDTDPLREGLGLLGSAIAPHYASDHPESATIDRAIEYLEKHKFAYTTLRDGDVLMQNGGPLERFPRTRATPQTVPDNGTSTAPDAGQ